MSLWNITENITAEIGDYINYAMALSRNIETINMVVLNIIQYKLAAQEFPGTAHFIYISITGDELRPRVAAFSRRFLTLAYFERLPRRDGVS